MNREEVYETR